MVVVALDRLLPFSAPGRRALGRGVVADRRAADDLDLQVAAAHEPERPVVEVVGAEIVHRHRDGARAHEGVDVDGFVEEQVYARRRLVRVVASHDAGVGDRVVGLADAREQQQPHVVDAEGAQHHDLGGLEDLFAGGVHVGHAACPLFVGRQLHAQYVGAGADFEVLHLHRHRQDTDLRRGLGEVLAAEVGTESASADGCT
ncbi:hypothetical protein G6F50_015557 [Rhizopus delemar]|uniref:Uncharacterized protein n=1 Tax=Rhizopus delemar TaxID=936053 RepID=A0A9P6XX41_9FUNG|nr:hypothetical protein G6F50_015557 [Rhizopus delemar]